MLPERGQALLDFIALADRLKHVLRAARTGERRLTLGGEHGGLAAFDFRLHRVRRAGSCDAIDLHRHLHGRHVLGAMVLDLEQVRMGDHQLHRVAIDGFVSRECRHIIRIAQRLKKVTLQSQTTLGRIAELVQEALAGLRVVQAFGLEEARVAQFGALSRRHAMLSMKQSVIFSAYAPLSAFIDVADRLTWISNGSGTTRRGMR